MQTTIDITRENLNLYWRNLQLLEEILKINNNINHIHLKLTKPVWKSYCKGSRNLDQYSSYLQSTLRILEYAVENKNGEKIQNTDLFMLVVVTSQKWKSLFKKYRQLKHPPLVLKSYGQKLTVLDYILLFIQFSKDFAKLFAEYEPTIKHRTITRMGMES